MITKSLLASLAKDDGQAPAILGYAAVWGSLASPPHTGPDYVRPGAFAESLIRPRIVIATVCHFRALTFAAGPSEITLMEDDTGLLCLIRPQPSALVRLIIDSMRSGSFNQMSCSFRYSDANVRRGAFDELRKATCWEVCLTGCAVNRPVHRHTCARLVRLPSWPADPNATGKLTALVVKAQQSLGEKTNGEPLNVA